MKEFWLQLARDNLQASMACMESHYASAVSRAYYSAFAAGHALLIHAGAKPRADFGTWSHEDLPLALRSTLSRGTMPVTRSSPTEIQIMIQRCYQRRLAADYAPSRSIDRQIADDSRRDAGRVLAFVERIVE